MLSDIKNQAVFDGVSTHIAYKINKILTDYKICEDLASNLQNTGGYSVRYQDYFNIGLNAKDNINFFIKYCPNADEYNIVMFCKYILEKELDDFWKTLNNPEEETIELFEIFDGYNIFDNAIYVLNEMLWILEKNKSDEEIKNVVNLIITPDDFDSIINLNGGFLGHGKMSLERSFKALNTLFNVSYNNPENSRKIHKVVDNSQGHDLRFTDYKILLERYSTGETTKVVFLKMPVCSDNMNLIREMFDNKKLENIYYIVGFGDFKYAGKDEYHFYKNLIKMATASVKYIQKVADLVNKPLMRYENGKLIDNREDFKTLVENSMSNIKSLDQKSLAR